uniref:Uncharacterized protein n=1 Tax=uncultured Acidobacteriota bacterium TaxID=171953 RepID=Q7X2W1_9BACT|nr:hypothetical protein [uncultured Acidobacteriota bacterium]
MAPPERQASRTGRSCGQAAFLAGLRAEVVIGHAFVSGILLMTGIGLLVRGLHADPDDLVRDGGRVDVLGNQRALGLGQEPQGARLREHVLPEPESQRWPQLRVGKEHAAVGCNRQPLHGLGMPQREEDQAVVVAVLTVDVVDEPGRPRALLPDPFELVLPDRRLTAETAAQARERHGVVRLAHREAPDDHAAHAVRALKRGVLPGA